MSTTELVLLTFCCLCILQGIHSAKRRKSMPCDWWRKVEDSVHVRNLNCNHDNKCFILNCTGTYHNHQFAGGMIFQPCDSPPQVELWLNAPSVGITNWNHKFIHDQQFSIPNVFNSTEFDGFISASITRTSDVFNVSLAVKGCVGNGSQAEQCPLVLPLINAEDIIVDPCLQDHSTTYMQRNNNLNVHHEQKTETFSGKPCKISELFACDSKATCVQVHADSNDGYCKPLPSEIAKNTHSLSVATTPKPVNERSRSSTTMITIITICLFILFVALSVIVIYRYRIMGQIRVWLYRLRSSTSDQLRIGNDDDDAPVA